MHVEIHPPHALHEKGQRSGNEDYIYPISADNILPAQQKLFVVCDGVGGAEKGEEASRIVCESFAESLDGLDNVFSHDFERALEMAEYRIDAYVEAYPDAEGMATTLALLVFDMDGAKISHIGDSRVYQIRNGQILFKTSDHSLVNEMVLSNIITAEEALNHPKRNVVSRAIMGTQRPSKMDTAVISDIMPDDYFFLCTDGILESVSDITLVSILSQPTTDEHKMSEISSLCQQFSKDNFSAYLVRVKDVFTNAPKQQQETNNHQPLEKREESSGVLPKWAAYLLIFVFVAAVLMLLATVVSMG